MILGCPHAATEPTAMSTFLFQNGRLKKKKKNTHTHTMGQLTSMELFCILDD